MDYNQNSPGSGQEIPLSKTPGQTADKMNPFAIASLVCGICSIVFCCVGLFSIPLGALGILFTILAGQKGKGMSAISITGLVLSIIGLVFGLITSIYVAGVYLSDSAYRRSLEDGYRNDYRNFYYHHDEYDDHHDHYNDYYDDYYNDYYDDYYDDYFNGGYNDYFEDFFRDDYDDNDYFFDDFYNYGFENLRSR